MAKKQEPSPKTMRVLFVAAEADPIIKVGGLGDVTGTLPREIRALEPSMTSGNRMDVRLAIPYHSAIRKRMPDLQPVVSFNVPHPDGPIAARAFLTQVGELPVYMIDGAPIPQDAPVYSLDAGEDGEKFTFFSLAVLELARALDWPPDILHANDWHTALAVYALALRRSQEQDSFFANTRTMLSVHNLPFMGAGTDEAMEAYGIPPLDDDRLPLWGGYQPLPMGLATADYLTTVSPTYAREILTPEFGCGLENFLQSRSDTIAGILNGLDMNLWDPHTDTALAVNFDSETLDKRLANKQALIREFGLPANLDLPLLVMVTRMDRQKGVDLAIEGLRDVAGIPWQAILLGSGDPGLEAAARTLEAEFPYRVRTITRFDPHLARRLYGGGDMLLMPSRYEPGGLAQMIAMRYGCIPVVRATGGLRDTVKDSSNPKESNGFRFEEESPEALAAVVRRGVAAYAEPKTWRERQLNGMAQDFSWQRSALAYVKIYQQLIETKI